MKRALDVVASAVGLGVLSPLLAAIAVVVRRAMGVPVLYIQQRPGRGCRLFDIYKFRTMTDEHDNYGELLPDAERLIPAGSMLRRWSLDELPQLWNVLRGDMSLVGPRPLVPEYLPLYTPEQARRHDVKPGITGLAQVLDRNDTTWERRFTLDIWYVDNWSFWLDLRILTMTVARVISSEGMAAPGYVTMPRFSGSTIDSKGENQKDA